MHFGLDLGPGDPFETLAWSIILAGLKSTLNVKVMLKSEYTSSAHFQKDLAIADNLLSVVGNYERRKQMCRILSLGAKTWQDLMMQ